MVAGEKVDIAAAEGCAELLILRFRIQTNNRLAGLPNVREQQLEQIAFALTRVAENEDIGAGLVFVALIEVYYDVAAVFVLADVEAFSVSFARVVEREQICDRAGWQDALVLRAEGVEPDRTDGAEACLLAELQPVHVQLRAHELDLHICLQNLEFLHITRDHFDVDGAVQKRLLVPVQRADEVRHVLQIALCFH